MKLSKGPMMDLKRMVETTDLRTVVQALATIARNKGIDLADNGTGQDVAERWDRASRQLESCADSTDILAIRR